LVKSFVLSSRKGDEATVEPIIDTKSNTIRYRVRAGDTSKSARSRTIGRKGGTCLITGVPIPFEYIRSEGKSGNLGLQLLAAVAQVGDKRIFIEGEYARPTESVDIDFNEVPDVEMAYNPFSLRPPLYGLKGFCELFTARQLKAMTTFSNLVSEARGRVHRDAQGTWRDPPNGAKSSSDSDYATAVATYLAFAVSRGADYWSAGATWETSGCFVGHTFTRQAIPMVWDFCEANPLGNASGNWLGAVDWVARVVERSPFGVSGTATQCDAGVIEYAPGSQMVSTDPPYYNNVDYADLSDYFYVWLRRSLGKYYPELFRTMVTPKANEMVATPYRFDGDADKAADFFEFTLRGVFRRMIHIQSAACPSTIYYAFKQAERADSEDTEANGVEEGQTVSTGWETMLKALVDVGFAITGTWPMRTERSARSMSINMNSLASSVVLVCRARGTEASETTRKEFIASLRRELPIALRDLQHGSIAPVDLAQSAIGPGMAVFTRYSKVMENDGSPMTIRTALGLINQTLDEVLSEQEGEFDTDTRWALAWFEQFGMDEGPFGVAETLSKAKNTAVSGLVEAGVVKARGGKVHLVKREELPEDWEPRKDKRLTIWEVTQYLIRTLDQKGESGAAALLHKVGGLGETARDLAYRLYTICERKKWADEALAYNGLVIAWPELTKLALAERSKPRDTQQEMF
jgi:putative DNA methylase